MPSPPLPGDSRPGAKSDAKTEERPESSKPGTKSDAKTEERPESSKPDAKSDPRVDTHADVAEEHRAPARPEQLLSPRVRLDRKSTDKISALYIDAAHALVQKRISYTMSNLILRYENANENR